VRLPISPLRHFDLIQLDVRTSLHKKLLNLDIKKKVVEIFFYNCSENLQITINYFAFENKTISNRQEKKLFQNRKSWHTVFGIWIVYQKKISIGNIKNPNELETH
jgi:hypothetical protein